MTIAGLYLSPEGVVLGADSTSSVSGPNGLHFFDFTQKLFEIGEPGQGTLGMLTWGLGGLGSTSYRTLIALLSDDLAVNQPKSVNEVAERWVELFWDEYTKSELVKQYKDLVSKSPYNKNTPVANMRTEQEQRIFEHIDAVVAVGFCIAGYVLPGRVPEAVSVRFHPNEPKPTPVKAQQHSLSWWGMPNFFQRLLFGIDPGLIATIVNSGNWKGTEQDLQALAGKHAIVPGVLPIRDAVDYVYSCIYCTIKAMKFSPLPQMCGGPVEIAVITTDRKFRWVRHKKWDAAITDGEIE